MFIDSFPKLLYSVNPVGVSLKIDRIEEYSAIMGYALVRGSIYHAIERHGQRIGRNGLARLQDGAVFAFQRGNFPRPLFNFTDSVF